MPARAYTETFVRLIGAGAFKEYVIPSGLRAVVKSLVICQRGATPTLVQAYVANTVLYYREIPGVASTEIFAMTAVAYEGEPIGLYQSNTGCHLQISGYLFEDPEGSPVPHSPADEQGVPGDPPRLV